MTNDTYTQKDIAAFEKAFLKLEPHIEKNSKSYPLFIKNAIRRLKIELATKGEQE